MFNDKRIRVIIGHYGSGKTEFSVNYALGLAKAGKKVALGDLDIVNPYFRSREKAEMLEENGVTVISGALGHHANLDLPMVSAAMVTPLQDESYDCILDVGGDSVGARALVRYKQYFRDGEYDMFFVLNANRPETQTVEASLNYAKDIEDVVGVKITGIINNTHLLRETSVEDIMAGQELAEKVAKELNVPVKYIGAYEKIAGDIPKSAEGEVLPIKMYMREDWM
jgi:MinD-like ATPase involved in chromosome partitioning or flagellar assembly